MKLIWGCRGSIRGEVGGSESGSDDDGMTAWYDYGTIQICASDLMYFLS